MNPFFCGKYKENIFEDILPEVHIIIANPKFELIA